MNKNVEPKEFSGKIGWGKQDKTENKLIEPPKSEEALKVDQDDKEKLEEEPEKLIKNSNKNKDLNMKVDEKEDIIDLNLNQEDNRDQDMEEDGEVFPDFNMNDDQNLMIEDQEKSLLEMDP